MGLFGNKEKKDKEKKPISANVFYYSGDLTGFSQGDPCTITLAETMFTIMRGQKGGPLTVSLERSRILGIDDFPKEEEYMLKYHGQKATTKLAGASLGVEKSYLVIRYKAKDGSEKQLDFWYTTFEGVRVIKLQGAFKFRGNVANYSI